MTNSAHLNSALRQATMPVLFVIIWQVAVARFGFGDGFVPSPVGVAQALGVWIFGGDPADRYSGVWLGSVIVSCERVLAGFVIAALVGTVLGLLIGRSRIAADLLDPLVQILRPIPVSAWVPFALIFFGIGPASAISLVALGAFFPIVLNATAGARSVQDIHLRGARMLGAGRWRTTALVVLPAALPSIMTGVRLGMGLSWVLLIVAEMVAVKSGLGYDLWNAYYYARMDILVAAMLTIGALGLVSDILVRLLARRLLRWQVGA